MSLTIAVIPARGGSKRIPRKNILEFSGQPMIAWSIQAAIQANCFDHIIVSTDDEEIADIAKKYGAEVPFLRPKALSDDFTATVPVIKHAINACEQHYLTEIAQCCCIYATAPFLDPKKIQLGHNILKDNQRDYVFSACPLPAPVERTFQTERTGGVKMLFPEHFSTRSQDLPITFYDAAQFYWGTSQAWTEEIPVFSQNAECIPLPADEVQDFDTLEDWRLGELKFELFRKE